jgi:hypothetical protein
VAGGRLKNFTLKVTNHTKKDRETRKVLKFAVSPSLFSSSFFVCPVTLVVENLY